MWNLLRRSLMLAVLCSTAALTACLQEDKDPARVAAEQNAGELNGAFYASGLGNIALKIQNYVVSDASWFNALTASQEVTMADIGVNPDIMGVTVKSHICPVGVASSVRQLTWIDARDPATGKFVLKGVGADASTIMASLSGSVSAGQVGIYKSGTSIEMGNGVVMDIPAACSGVNIPAGAPVLAFEISRPAPPVSAMSRTEYRTEACEADSSGRDRHGTKIMKRIVTYNADGSFTEGVWGTQDMGQCIDDVVVTMSDPTFTAEKRNADLSAFAGRALHSLLANQLKMGCTEADVASDRTNKQGGVRKQDSKSIDTCGNRARGDGTTSTVQIDDGDTSDVRVLECDGKNVLASIRLNNPLSGTTTTEWTSGTATLVRIVEKYDIDGADTGRRTKWVGDHIGCFGDEKFYVECGGIPGAPTARAKGSWTKWIETNLEDSAAMTDLSMAFATTFISGTGGIMIGAMIAVSAIPVFGLIFAGIMLILNFLCLFGCTEMTFAKIETLNPEYFSDVWQSENGGTTAIRDIKSTVWTNAETFTPRVDPASKFKIYKNHCEWSSRIITGDVCPTTVDMAKVDNTKWPRFLSASSGPPLTLNLGSPPAGNSADEHYQKFYDPSTGWYSGYVSYVHIGWKKRSLFSGTKHWTDTAGPGRTYFFGRRDNQDGASVQTTVLDMEGLIVAQRPKIDANEYMKYDQDGYAEAINCGRTETRTYTWPVVVQYSDCGGKGGCHSQSYSTTTTVTEYRVREWAGETLENGRWTNQTTHVTSPHGSWANMSQVPNPIVTNSWEAYRDMYYQIYGYENGDSVNGGGDGGGGSDGGR